MLRASMKASAQSVVAVGQVVDRYLSEFEQELAVLRSLSEPDWRARRVSQAFFLGPLSVARAARAKSRFDRLADFGVSHQANAPNAHETSERVRVTTSNLGAAVALTLRALREQPEAPLTVELASAVPNTRLETVFEPLLEHGTLRFEQAVDKEAAALAPERATMLVAPFYYARHDVDRLADHIVLELEAPSPLAEGGIDLVYGAHWDQRHQLLEAVKARQAHGDGTRSLTLHPIDADGAEGLLTAALGLRTTLASQVLSAFVYPMLRERPTVEAQLQSLNDDAPLFILNARPTLAFWLGTTRGRVDVSQLLRPAPAQTWCDKRLQYERNPSWAGALSSAATQWVPSLLRA
jgi:hypothetical protein